MRFLLLRCVFVCLTVSAMVPIGSCQLCDRGLLMMFTKQIFSAEKGKLDVQFFFSSMINSLCLRFSREYFLSLLFIILFNAFYWLYSIIKNAISQIIHVYSLRVKISSVYNSSIVDICLFIIYILRYHHLLSVWLIHTYILEMNIKINMTKRFSEKLLLKPLLLYANPYRWDTNENFHNRIS